MTQADDSGSDSAMVELPEKTYFKIGEVAKLLEVEPYVLRYWETEFDVLAPEKTKSGQRVYQRPDIELLFQIRSLLYEEMFTIAGARRQLARSREGKTSYFDLEEGRSTAQGTAVAGDEQLRAELEEARQQMAATETTLEQTQQQLQKARADHAEAEQELEDLRQELSRVRQSRSGLEAELEAMEERLDEQEQDGDEQLIAELQQEVVTLQKKLDATEDEAAERRRALRQKLQDREEYRHQLLGSLRGEVETLAALAKPGSRAAY